MGGDGGVGWPVFGFTSSHVTAMAACLFRAVHHSSAAQQMNSEYVVADGKRVTLAHGLCSGRQMGGDTENNDVLIQTGFPFIRCRSLAVEGELE
ncbi:hypothetical protein QQF64_024914 [Cirrhinus molitorella]|uniref:Uncharacterized protein n=1 Tax=Cirrhinus molitorella TaxID=172907 RepID=A0ABR3NNK1_9TELE